jgi:predicted nucleic acid-binding protein
MSASSAAPPSHLRAVAAAANASACKPSSASEHRCPLAGSLPPSLDVRRAPINGALLDAAWRMRDNIAARDALNVAAARGLGCRLLTTDERLGRAVPDLAIGFA